MTWEEPVSAVYSSREQSELSDDLQKLEEEERGRDREQASARSRVRKRKRARRQQAADLRARARALNARVGDSQAFGRIAIDDIDLQDVFVKGTGGESLRKGPSHYNQTGLPGQGRTIGIAGHRTTYSAPFRHVDNLHKGDPIVIRMPYGRFTYAVEKTEIVQPERVDVLESNGYERLVLTACHPLYSAAQRIVVFARLVKRSAGATPLGAFNDDDDFIGRFDPGGDFADGPVLFFIVIGLMAAMVGVVASTAALAQAGPGRANENMASLVGSVLAAAGLVLVFFGLIP